MLGYLHKSSLTPEKLTKTRLRASQSVAAFLAQAIPPTPVEQKLDHLIISSESDFASLSTPATDLIVNGRLMKFLIDLRSATPQVHFVNGNFMENGVVSEDAKYHFNFAKRELKIPEELEEFNQITYFGATKTRYVAGAIHSYFLNNASEPIYAIQFYPQDSIHEQDILKMVLLVKEQITISEARFAFVVAGSQQTTATITTQMSDAGIEILTLDQVLGTIQYIPLNMGEAWGYLRMFPANYDDLKPEDIPIFDELPLDLSVVAGVITKTVQDNNSHVNLKSKERGTPNMVLRDANPEHLRLKDFIDKPIHLTVRQEDFLIEEVDVEEVKKRIEDRNNLPWIDLKWDTETRLLSYDEMAAGNTAQTLAFASRYGSKATNLGFLAHREVLGRKDQPDTPSHKSGYDLVPFGFGVPLSFYDRFVNYEPNEELRKKLAEFIALEKAGTLSNSQRANFSLQIHDLFLASEFPPDDLQAIKDKLREVLPEVNKIKVRSSANAEDIPNFDGAGLHDSFAATVNKVDSDPCRIVVDEEDGHEVKRKVKPKTVECAIRGVYASLWNKRAIEERSFARINHATVAMGLAIVPSYDIEADVVANAVVITRVINTEHVYGYGISVQQGNNLVTNPDPNTYSEVVVVALGSGTEPTTFSVMRHAKPTANGAELTTNVLAQNKMLEIIDMAVKIEKSYCRSKPSYYPQGNCRNVIFDSQKPKSLDMELKILEGGHIVFKQVREFGGK